MNSEKQTIHKIDPSQWVEQHGDCLYRYALLHLKDPHIAEDMVQETFIAALQSRSRFSGRSSEQTWLVGILKHKVMDYFRKQYRERNVQSDESNNQNEHTLDDFFDRHDHWRLKPSRQFHPRSAFQEKEFWQFFSQCMEGLPGRMSEAFTLRVLDNLPTEEVCNILNVSTTNLGAILHRARLRLRECLDKNYFQKPKGKT